MNKRRINEGLRTGDLKDLVSNEISIDEFESKIDTDAIVVGFYIEHENPAKDLSSFIESGVYDVLDTEVSPAPDEKGNYVVFVEFLRDSKFPTNLKRVLDGLKSLTGNSNWSFSYYKSHGKVIKFNMKSIKEKIRLEKKEEVIADESLSFFKPSLLEGASRKGNQLELKKRGKSFVYEHIALGDPQLLFHLLQITNRPLSLDTKSLSECNSLRTILGKNWDINKIDEFYILANSTDERIMVVK